MMRRLLGIGCLAGILLSSSACSITEVKLFFEVRGVTITDAEALAIADQVNAGRPPGCDPFYEGACVPDNVSDVDCEADGSNGDGPAFVRGPFGPVRWDHLGLDPDRDGVACNKIWGPWTL